MASLALGAAGGYFFGPLGFLIGSALGNLLFPQKQEGPRLTDLHTSTSAYGEMIPYVFGRYRVPLKVTWADKLQEHKHTSGGKGGPRLSWSPYGIRRAVDRGGKGGPDVTTYTYTCSFYGHASMGPIAEIRKLWFDKQLVWDAGQDTSADIPFTAFLGGAAQEPFSVAEGILGVGNVSGHRGKAGLGFDTLLLSDYGNRIPNIEAEVIQKAGPIPWRVSTFEPKPETVGSGQVMKGQATMDPVTQQITVGETYSNTYNQNVFDIDGNVISAGTPVTIPPVPGASTAAGIAQVRGGQLFYGYNGSDNNAFYYNGSPATGVIDNPIGPGGDFAAVQDDPAIVDGVLYVIGSYLSTIYVGAIPTSGGIPGTAIGPVYVLPSGPASTWEIAQSDDGYIYVALHGGSAALNELYKFDKTLTVVYHWVAGTLPVTFDPGDPFFIYNGLLVFNATRGGPGYGCYVYQINGDHTFTHVGDIPQIQGGCVYLGDGLLLGGDGVISLVPPPSGITLGEIVAAISDICSQPDYDVDSLTDQVDGYCISTQGSGVAAISTLQNAWPFDAVESANDSGDPIMKFVRRGQSAIITIPDDDLAARTRDQEAPPILEITRKLESELPRTVYTKYANVDADYQDGSQYVRREVTVATSDITIEMAIAMSDAYGKTVAAVYLFGAWYSRTSFKFYTSVKYAWLEPTDVVIIGLYTMRITKKTEHLTGIIEWEALQDDPSLWVRAYAGAGGVGNGTPPITGKSTTVLLALDLPLLNDADEPNGYYAAAVPTGTPSGWSMNLYESRDGGTTYDAIDGTGIADVTGTCSNALTEWTGDYVFDETQKLTVVTTGGALASVSRDEALAGAFRFLAGSEVIYGRDATLVDVNTYDITGMLRGMRGTDKLTGTHQAGERFVLLPPTMNPHAAFADLGLPLKLKGVTKGLTVAGATAIDFTNRGMALKCYAPCLVGGGPNTSDDVVVNWTRRSRIGGDWIGGSDAPLGESVEKYELEFWDSTYTVCARTIESSTPTATYLEADQVTDFGAKQSSYYVSVGQVGSYGIGTRARAVIPGAGAVVNDPIVSVVPYDGVPSLPPPPPPSGPPPPVDHDFGAVSGSVAPTFVVGNTYVYTFTTSGTPSARLSSFETAHPGFRHAWLSTDGTASGKVPGSDSYGVTVAIDTDSLTPSTQYYFIIDFKWPDGSWLETPGELLPSLVTYVVTS
jgi:hypothetical protein